MKKIRHFTLIIGIIFIQLLFCRQYAFAGYFSLRPLALDEAGSRGLPKVRIFVMPNGMKLKIGLTPGETGLLGNPAEKPAKPFIFVGSILPPMHISSPAIDLAEILLRPRDTGQADHNSAMDAILGEMGDNSDVEWVKSTYYVEGDAVPDDLKEAVQRMADYAVNNGGETKNMVGDWRGFDHVHLAVPRGLPLIGLPEKDLPIVLRNLQFLLGHSQELVTIDRTKRSILGPLTKGDTPCFIPTENAYGSVGIGDLGEAFIEAGSILFRRQPDGSLRWFLLLDTPGAAVPSDSPIEEEPDYNILSSCLMRMAATAGMTILGEDMHKAVEAVKNDPVTRKISTKDAPSRQDEVFRVIGPYLARKESFNTVSAELAEQI